MICPQKNCTCAISSPVSTFVLFIQKGITLTTDPSNSTSSLLQDKPVLAFAEDPETLTHSFLIRQSCAISYEAASKLYTHIYLAIEDNCTLYDKGNN